MNELILLKILLNNNSYHKYKALLNINSIKETSKEVSYIYNALIKLKENVTDKDIAIEELKAFFYTLYPTASKDIYDGLFDNIAAENISEDVGLTIINQINLSNQALKLSQKAFDFTQGRSSIDEIKALSDELTSVISDKVDILEEDTDLEKLLNSSLKNEGLRWRLDFLNKSLGSIREGDFGFLMKRPESGGTAFSASEVGFMLPQTNRNVVWINNEEANDKVMLRIYQAYFGVTIHQLMGNAEHYKKRFQDEVQGRLKFFGIDRSNKKDIEYIVGKYNPVLVIYDQLDKVQGFDADREDLRLGAIYEWARNLTKKGHSALGITQADGSAEGVKYLHMGHVSNAKTSKQAEADFIIGLGKSNDEGTENIRYITICKNKLLGSPDTMPTFRHGRMEVMIQPEIMQFRDFIQYT